MTSRQFDVLRAVTSNDFNRVVWSQTNQIPEPAYAALPRLDMALSTITDTSTGQTVVLGDERYGAKIELVRERDTLLVDRVLMLGGPQAENSELKHTLQDTLGTPHRAAANRTRSDELASHRDGTVEDGRCRCWRRRSPGCRTRRGRAGQSADAGRNRRLPRSSRTSRDRPRCRQRAAAGEVEATKKPTDWRRWA